MSHPHYLQAASPGTNDARLARLGIDANKVSNGMTRVIKLLQSSYSALNRKTVDVMVLPPFPLPKRPAYDERRTSQVLPGLMKAIRACPRCYLGPQIDVGASKHKDGVHLTRAGCTIVANKVAKAIVAHKKLSSRAQSRTGVKRKPKSTLSTSAKTRASHAARQVGKSIFLGYSRKQLREFAKKYDIPLKGGNKDAEFASVLASIGVNWQKSI